MEKLVRDKIPDLMIKDGHRPVLRILAHHERLQWLLTKLEEETSELTATPNLEECIDVLEVLSAIASDLGYSSDDLARAAAIKREKNGGFVDGVVIYIDRKTI